MTTLEPCVDLVVPTLPTVSIATTNLIASLVNLVSISLQPTLLAHNVPLLAQHVTLSTVSLAN